MVAPEINEPRAWMAPMPIRPPPLDLRKLMKPDVPLASGAASEMTGVAGAAMVGVGSALTFGALMVPTGAWPTGVVPLIVAWLTGLVGVTGCVGSPPGFA